MSRSVEDCTATIEIKNVKGVAMYKRKEVILPVPVLSGLLGAGNGSEITIYKKNLIYKKDEAKKELQEN